MNKKTIIYSVESALPVMTGYIVLSIGFGLLLVKPQTLPIIITNKTAN